MDEKAELRRSMRRLRKGIPEGDRTAADSSIARRVVGLEAWRSSDLVLTYLSFGSEVSTRGLVRRAWEEGKRVAIPRVVPNARRMRWFAVTSLDGLERSSFGVEEPRIDPALEVATSCGRSCVALVPGLAFDRRGFRLGYGGGFYDTFLSSFGGTSVGLCREAQLLDDLAEAHVLEAHDLPVDLVVTELETIRGAGDDPEVSV